MAPRLPRRSPERVAVAGGRASGGREPYGAGNCGRRGAPAPRCRFWATGAARVLRRPGAVAGGGGRRAAGARRPGLSIPVAASSLPGDLLYGEKLAGESLSVALAGDSAATARLHFTLADRRATEIDTLVAQGRPQQATEALSNMAAHTSAGLTVLKQAPAAQQTDLLRQWAQVADHESRALSAVAPALALPGSSTATTAAYHAATGDLAAGNTVLATAGITLPGTPGADLPPTASATAGAGPGVAPALSRDSGVDPACAADRYAAASGGERPACCALNGDRGATHERRRPTAGCARTAGPTVQPADPAGAASDRYNPPRWRLVCLPRRAHPRRQPPTRRVLSCRPARRCRRRARSTRRRRRIQRSRRARPHPEADRTAEADGAAARDPYPAADRTAEADGAAARHPYAAADRTAGTATCDPIPQPTEPPESDGAAARDPHAEADAYSEAA